MNLGQRHVASALAFNGFDDVGSFQTCLIRRTAWDHGDHSCIVKTLRYSCSRLATRVALVLLEFLVLGWREIAGISVQRLQQTVQRTINYEKNVKLFHVFAAHAQQDLAVHLELTVPAIIAGNVHPTES